MLITQNLSKSGCFKEVKQLSVDAKLEPYTNAALLIESGKVKPLFKDKPFFKEFAVVLDKDVDKVNEGLEDKGILGGYNITKNYENHKNLM